ncbi:urate hydroxylase PuuD [Craterilacuibacter sp.]|uniref:urate hydroxylase PuuD n=1 Tax=Craterilacuibacter sp. TaxID=2870909 RepID=UPI003F37EE5B
MDGYWLDWAGLLLRWLHVIAATAWIGASFYFVWLDNHLTPPQEPALQAKGVSGELWAVHGGGFYNPQKYRLAPPVLPEKLHWFRWEAYTTWLSGMALLSTLYFLRPGYLVDPGVAALTQWQATMLALGMMLLGTLLYESVCRMLAGRSVIQALLLILLVGALSFAFAQFFAPRAAFLLTGATLASWMAGNVLWVIIPGQRRMVAAMSAQRQPDAGDGLRGKQRSLHNNYLTLPVLLAMISNHYAFLYQHKQSWLVLWLLMLAGALIRHFFNRRHHGVVDWRFPAGACLLLALVAWRIAPPAVAPQLRVEGVDVVQVQRVLTERCVSCHAAKPTQAGFAAPPAGLRLDDHHAIAANAVRIHQQVVLSRTMPLANLTQMTESERQLISRWFAAQGQGVQP